MPTIQFIFGVMCVFFIVGKEGMLIISTFNCLKRTINEQLLLYAFDHTLSQFFFVRGSGHETTIGDGVTVTQ